MIIFSILGWSYEHPTFNVEQVAPVWGYENYVNGNLFLEFYL